MEEAAGTCQKSDQITIGVLQWVEGYCSVLMCVALHSTLVPERDQIRSDHFTLRYV